VQAILIWNFYDDKLRLDQPALFEFGTGFLTPETDAQKGAGDGVSKQRPKIGDYDALEIAAKTAFLLASCQLRVSEDWVVGRRPEPRAGRKQAEVLQAVGRSSDRKKPDPEEVSR
jgi:hypothetical protein